MDNTAQLRAIKVALHETDHILNQQIALRLHDGGWIGPNKDNKKVVARFGAAGFFIVFKFSVVESDFKLCASSRNFIDVHAQVIKHLSEVFVAPNRPAKLKLVVGGFETDAGFFFVKTLGPFGERFGACIFP